MSTGILDDLLVGSRPKNPFGNDANDQMAPIGTTVTGTILDVERKQATDPANNTPQTWDDGNPKMQGIITLQTTLREDAEDDGRRTVYIKMWGLQKQALMAASQAAGGGPAIGDTFTATFTGLGKKTNPAFNAPKIYEYKLVKGSPLATDLDTPAASTPAPASAPAPVSAGLGEAQKAQIAKLVAVGLDDAKIAQALSFDLADVIAARAQLAADSTSGGF